MQGMWVFAFFAAGHIYVSQADYVLAQSYYKDSNCKGTVWMEVMQLDGCFQEEENLSRQMTCSSASHGVEGIFTNGDCSGEPTWYNTTEDFGICQEDHGSAFSVKPSLKGWTSAYVFSCVSSVLPAPVPTGYGIHTTRFAGGFRGGSTCSNLVPRTIVFQEYVLVNTCINDDSTEILSCNKTSLTVSIFDSKDTRCTNAAISTDSASLGCREDKNDALVYECLA